MKSEVNAPLTWHLRIVNAVAAKTGCSTSARRTPRIIGGRRTSKTDRAVCFEGSEAAVTEAMRLVEEHFGDLHVRSNAYLRTLVDATPAERKLARRAWLEAQAQAVADKLTGG